MKLGNKLNFEHTNKWYVHNPGCVHVNEMQKHLWDFEMKADHVISGIRPELVIFNNKKRCYQIVDFVISAEHGVKVKRKGKERQLLIFCQWVEKTREHESEGDTNCNWCAWNGHEMLGTGAGKIGNQRMSRDHANYRIAKSARILRRVLETWGYSL